MENSRMNSASAVTEKNKISIGQGLIRNIDIELSYQLNTINQIEGNINKINLFDNLTEVSSSDKISEVTNTLINKLVLISEIIKRNNAKLTKINEHLEENL